MKWLITVLLSINTCLVQAQALKWNPLPQNITVNLNGKNNTGLKQVKKNVSQVLNDSLEVWSKLEEKLSSEIKQQAGDIPVFRKLHIKKAQLPEFTKAYKQYVQQFTSAEDIRQQYRQLHFALKKRYGEVGPDGYREQRAVGNFTIAHSLLPIHNGQLEQEAKTTELDNGATAEEYLHTINDVKDSVQQYGQYYKQAEALEDTAKAASHYLDTLSLKDAEKLAKYTLKSARKLDDMESLQDKVDALDGRLQQWDEVQEKLEAIKSRDWDKLEKIANLAEDKFTNQEAYKALSEKVEEIQEMENNYSKQIEQIRQQVKMQDRLGQLQAGGTGELKNQAYAGIKSNALKYLDEHSEKWKAFQQELNSVKNKGLSFGNVDKVKVMTSQSLKDEPLNKRFYLGGTFQVIRETPTSLDLSPQLGYKLNKKLRLGIGGTYRIKLDKDYWNQWGNYEVFGGRLFAEYDVLWLFVHGEYERMSNLIEQTNSDGYQRVTANSAFLGLGKDLKLKGKLTGSIMLLYNFLHDADTSPYDKPFVFRFGVNFGK